MLFFYGGILFVLIITFYMFYRIFQLRMQGQFPADMLSCSALDRALGKEHICQVLDYFCKSESGSQPGDQQFSCMEFQWLDTTV
jgi:hypothetical protein